MECLRLRVHDLDFERGEILVRDGKGGKDRVTMLPRSLTPPLEEQLREAKAVHERDLADGWGRVALPQALARKYPNAPAEWRWQWVFPQQRRWRDPRTGEQGRHHVHPTVVQRAVAKPSAAPASPSTRPATRFATPSPRTCWQAATTSARSRNCSATAASPRP